MTQLHPSEKSGGMTGVDYDAKLRSFKSGLPDGELEILLKHLGLDKLVMPDAAGLKRILDKLGGSGNLHTRLLEALYAYKTGQQTLGEKQKLLALLKETDHHASDTVRNTVERDAREALLKPYADMTLDELRKLKSIPPEVLKAARESVEAAEGLLQVNAWLKIQEVKKDEKLVLDYLKTLGDDFVWNSLPEHIKAAVQRLQDAKYKGVEVSAGRDFLGRKIDTILQLPVTWRLTKVFEAALEAHLKTLGDKLPSTPAGIAYIRKQLADDPAALAAFNAWLAYKTGGLPSSVELRDLIAAFRISDAKDLIAKLDGLVTLVHRTESLAELLAPYHNLTLEQIRNMKPPSQAVIDAARDIGTWAPGRYEINIWLKMQEVKKDEKLVLDYLKTLGDDFVWNDLPEHIKAAVQRLQDAKYKGVDIGVGRNPAGEGKILQLPVTWKLTKVFKAALEEHLNALGDKIPSTPEGIANIRKELANDRAALAAFNAWLAYKTGGLPSSAELGDLLAAFRISDAKDLAAKVNGWVKLVYRQELLAPYHNLTLEQIRHLTPPSQEVIDAAREIGTWAPGLYEINIWLMMQEGFKAQTIIDNYLAVNKVDFSTNWSSIPEEVRNAVELLRKSRMGQVDVWWGGGIAQTGLMIDTTNQQILIDICIHSTLAGDAALSALVDAAGDAVLVIKLLTALMQDPPKAGNVGSNYAQEAAAYAKQLTDNLALVLGSSTQRGVLQVFYDALENAANLGLSDKAISHYLGAAFGQDIDGDGVYEPTVKGFLKDLIGLITGPNGLLDKTIAAVEATKSNFHATEKTEDRERLLGILNLVCAGASIMSGMAGNSCKIVAQYEAALAAGASMSARLKFAGDSIYSLGNVFDVGTAATSAFNNLYRSEKYIEENPIDLPVIGGSYQRLRDRLYDLSEAFNNLYAAIGPELPDSYKNFILEERKPTEDHPFVEGYIHTWWKRVDIADGTGTVYVYELWGIPGGRLKKPEGYGQYQ